MQSLEDKSRRAGAADDVGVLDPGEAWMRHMRHGDWEQAWRISDQQLPARAREPCTHWPRHLQYVWTGTSLAGKRVLVRCYHGLGDTLQFIRYAPLLKAIASEVVVWAQPGLIPLLSTVAGIDKLIPLHDGAPQADYDVDVEIMELPHIFHTTLATVPAKIPYLRAEPMPFPSSADRRPAIGLVWKAGDWAEQRSIPFSLLAPFAALTDVALFILQPDALAAGWNGEFGTFLGEFGLPDYARAIRSMDLLISIDSMPAHLAGAMGVPVWTLLHTDADWRWMDDREDSPWYPSMRLFRQRRADDWETVIEDVTSALVPFSSTRGS